MHTTQINRRVSLVNICLGAVLGAAMFIPAVTASADQLNPAPSSSSAEAAFSALSSLPSSLISETAYSISNETFAAISSNAAGYGVSIPVHPTGGIELSDSNGQKVIVELPGAGQARAAEQAANGVIAYPSSEPATNLVIPTQTGVQLLTVISSEAAPENYSYHFDLQPGQHLELEDGGAAVLNDDGTTAFSISATWAIDANGTAVPTHFQIEGQSLTQIVNHSSALGIAYPVVADPEIGFGIGWTSLYFNRSETHDIATAGISALGGAVAACAVGGPIGVAACGLAAGSITATA